MRRPHVQGDVFKLFMVGYMGWRFVIDFVKPGVALAGLTSLQWACFGMLVYYAPDVARWLAPQHAGLPVASTTEHESRQA